MTNQSFRCYFVFIAVFLCTSFPSTTEAQSSNEDSAPAATSAQEMSPDEAKQDEEKPASRGLMNLSLEELLNVVITTPSKSEETVARSTGIVTVITASEIQRAGYRTLNEVLQRVPGFFPTHQATWPVIGSRGFVADSNDHILLLVDGHRQNSILENGFQIQDMLPILDKVERIEIIRGPGSVLWGTSAVLGIINVITKDAPSSKTQVSGSYTYGDGMRTFSALQDLGLGDTLKGFISGTYWESDGFGDEQPYVEFPWGANTNIWPKLDDHFPGFEIYTKLKIGEKHELLGRVLQASIVYPWDSWSYTSADTLRAGAEYRMRKAYLNYRYTHDITPNLNIRYGFHGDYLLQNRFPTQFSGFSATRDTQWTQDQSRESFALGLDVDGEYAFTNRHALRFGTQILRNQVGPNRGFLFDVGTNLPTNPAAGQDQVPIIDIPSASDYNFSGYLEDKISFDIFGKSLDLFFGYRADYNTWREKKVVFLPRGGIILGLTDTVTIKYVGNTGYLRPNAAASKTGGEFFRSPSKTIETISNVDRSEEVISHDVQISWNKGKSFVAGTGFFMEIENFVSWETKLDLGYRNLGTARSYGFELEGRFSLLENLALNCNYSIVKSKLDSIPSGTDINGTTQPLDGAVTDDERNWLNYPTHIWNVGFNLILLDRHSVNLNLRGWHDMRIVEPYTSPTPSSYGDLSGEIYLDLTYGIQDLWKHFDLQIFGTNLLNNTEPIGLAINNGVYHPRGMNIGGKATYKF